MLYRLWMSCSTRRGLWDFRKRSAGPGEFLPSFRWCFCDIFFKFMLSQNQNANREIHFSLKSTSGFDEFNFLLRSSLTVFSFPNRCRTLFTISTRDNPRGLCEVSPMRSLSNSDPEFMVFPGYKMGSVQLIDLSTTEQHVSSAPVTINAHKSQLWCLAINQQVCWELFCWEAVSEWMYFAGFDDSHG